MKKILFGILVLLLSACSNEEIIESPQISGDKVELTLSVNIPEALSPTRSLGEPAEITSLYLVVFDNMGYLTEYVRATDLSPSGDETKFKVTLQQTPNKRIVHFIANYNIENLSYASESEIIGRMTVSDDEDAYWQRIEFPAGITDDDVTKAKMKRVPLVRNFAKINVIENLSNFALEGFAVINTLSAGTVAPYNTNGGGFARFADGEICNSYQNITTTQGYKGFNASSSVLQNTSPSWRTEPFYMYERSFPNDATATYILIKGKYGSSSKTTYYKVDIVYQNESGLPVYYNILRNFEYAITINSVVGDGYDSPEEAAKHPAGNNLSGSVETKSLLNISDGKARLFVNYTDTTLVSNKAITLKYKYIPDIQSTTPSNSDVKLDHVIAGNVIARVGTPIAAENGYSAITIYPKEPGNTTLSQTVTLYTANGLSREVTFTLRKAESMTVSCTNPVPADIGEDVTLSIKIPDGLSQTLFPLEFLIESDALSIYPDAAKDYMPVKVGETIDPNRSGSSFGYEKVLSYDDYKAITTENGKKEITCYFLTNKEESASTIYVYNKYFELGEVAFTNITMKEFTVTNSNLRAGSNISSYTVSVYTDEACTNEIATCKFSSSSYYNYRLTSNLSLRFPSNITKLYFRYYNNGYYTASVEVSTLEKGSQHTLSWVRSY